MKQKDIALLIVIIFVSGLMSFFVSRLFFATDSDRKQKAEVVDIISAEFPAPSSKYFNKDSINPTQLIQIGDSSNPNPFNGSSGRQ